MTAQQPRFGRYELTRELGVGATATVYRAFDQESRREVALKALAPALAADPEQRRAYLSAARGLQPLRHANLVPVFDVAEADGRPFFTMELVRGRTLSQILDGDTRLPYGRLVEVFRGISAAVDYLHRAGRQHGAISAANIMVKDSGRAVLMEPRLGIEPAPATDDLAALGAIATTLIAGAAGAEVHGGSLREIQPGLPEQVYATIEGATAPGSPNRPGSASEIAAAVAAATPAIATRESSTETLPVVRRARRAVEPAHTGPQPVPDISSAVPVPPDPQPADRVLSPTAVPPVAEQIMAPASPPSAPVPASPAAVPERLAPSVGSSPAPPSGPTRALDETIQVPVLARASSRPATPALTPTMAVRRSRLPLVVAAAVVVVLVAGGVVFALSRSGSGTTKPPAATTAATAASSAAGAVAPSVAATRPATTPAPLTPAAVLPSTAPTSPLPSATPTVVAPTSVASSVPVSSAVATGVGSPAPADGVQEIMADNKFTPDQLMEVAGRPLTLTIVNQGKAQHNFHVTSLNADDGHEIKTDLLDAGQSVTVTFTISAKGVYAYRCDVHPDEMRGVLTVQ
jgi:plastocyanin